MYVRTKFHNTMEVSRYLLLHISEVDEFVTNMTVIPAQV